jgi:predicted nucleic acid-binding protein
MSFLSSTDPSVFYHSVLTLGELRKWSASRERSDPIAAKSIASWVDGLELRFSDRILGVDAATARLWGEWSAERPRPVIDTLLAATAKTHELTFVTRNNDDIGDIPVKRLNPWKL